MSFCGVSRRGLSMCEVTTMPRALITETPKSSRMGRYAPDMSVLAVCEIVHELRSPVKKVPEAVFECQQIGAHFPGIYTHD